MTIERVQRSVRRKEIAVVVAVVGVVVVAILGTSSMDSRRARGTDIESVVSLPSTVSVLDEGIEVCGGGDRFQCGRTIEIRADDTAFDELLAALRAAGISLERLDSSELAGCDGDRCIAVRRVSPEVAEIDVTESRDG